MAIAFWSYMESHNQQIWPLMHFGMPR